MMAMAQLLNIRMPGSYELTFPPQTPDMPGVDDSGKGPCQSGMHLGTCYKLIVHLDCPVVSLDEGSPDKAVSRCVSYPATPSQRLTPFMQRIDSALLLL